MKLLFVTMEGCSTCIQKREMVYEELPTIFPGLEIEEYDVNEWDDVVKTLGRDIPNGDRAPGFVMVDDDGEIMFQVVGGPGPQYLARLVQQYKMIAGFSSGKTEVPQTNIPKRILSVECIKGGCVI